MERSEKHGGKLLSIISKLAERTGPLDEFDKEEDGGRSGEPISESSTSVSTSIIDELTNDQGVCDVTNIHVVTVDLPGSSTSTLDTLSKHTLTTNTSINKQTKRSSRKRRDVDLSNYITTINKQRTKYSTILKKKTITLSNSSTSRLKLQQGKHSVLKKIVDFSSNSASLRKQAKSLTANKKPISTTSTKVNKQLTGNVSWKEKSVNLSTKTQNKIQESDDTLTLRKLVEPALQHSESRITAVSCKEKTVNLSTKTQSQIHKTNNTVLLSKFMDPSVHNLGSRVTARRVVQESSSRTTPIRQALLSVGKSAPFGRYTPSLFRPLPLALAPFNITGTNYSIARPVAVSGCSMATPSAVSSNTEVTSFAGITQTQGSNQAHGIVETEGTPQTAGLSSIEGSAGEHAKKHPDSGGAPAGILDDETAARALPLREAVSLSLMPTPPAKIAPNITRTVPPHLERKPVKCGRCTKWYRNVHLLKSHKCAPEWYQPVPQALVTLAASSTESSPERVLLQLTPEVVSKLKEASDIVLSQTKEKSAANTSQTKTLNEQHVLLAIKEPMLSEKGRVAGQGSKVVSDSKVDGEETSKSGTISEQATRVIKILNKQGTTSIHFLKDNEKGTMNGNRTSTAITITPSASESGVSTTAGACATAASSVTSFVKFIVPTQALVIPRQGVSAVQQGKQMVSLGMKDDKPLPTRSIPCKHCDKKFYWQVHLRFHVERKHANRNTEERTTTMDTRDEDQVQKTPDQEQDKPVEDQKKPDRELHKHDQEQDKQVKDENDFDQKQEKPHQKHDKPVQEQLNYSSTDKKEATPDHKEANLNETRITVKPGQEQNEANQEYHNRGSDPQESISDLKRDKPNETRKNSDQELGKIGQKLGQEMVKPVQGHSLDDKNTKLDQARTKPDQGQAKPDQAKTEPDQGKTKPDQRQDKPDQVQAKSRDKPDSEQPQPDQEQTDPKHDGQKVTEKDTNILGQDGDDKTKSNVQIDASSVDKPQQNPAKEDPRANENYCDHCDKTFDQTEALRLHVKKAVWVLKGKLKEVKERDISCPKCDRTFTEERHMRCHLFTHQAQAVKCDVCQKMCRNENALKVHKGREHSVLEFICEHCGKKRLSKKSLGNHLRTHREKIHKCGFCEKSFFSSNRLQAHQAVHTGDKPYKCKECGRGFVLWKDLSNHGFVHKTDKPYKCDMCDKSYKRPDALRVHKISHSEDKPFKCDTCGRKFNQKICLTLHLPCREEERRQKREEARKRREEKLAKKESSKSSNKRKSKEQSGNPSFKRIKSTTKGRETEVTKDFPVVESSDKSCSDMSIKRSRKCNSRKIVTKDSGKVKGHGVSEESSKMPPSESSKGASSRTPRIPKSSIDEDHLSKETEVPDNGGRETRSKRREQNAPEEDKTVKRTLRKRTSEPTKQYEPKTKQTRTSRRAKSPAGAEKKNLQAAQEDGLAELRKEALSIDHNIAGDSCKDAEGSSPGVFEQLGVSSGLRSRGSRIPGTANPEVSNQNVQESNGRQTHHRSVPERVPQDNLTGTSLDSYLLDPSNIIRRSEPRIYSTITQGSSSVGYSPLNTRLPDQAFQHMTECSSRPGSSSYSFTTNRNHTQGRHPCAQGPLSTGQIPLSVSVTNQMASPDSCMYSSNATPYMSYNTNAYTQDRPLMPHSGTGLAPCDDSFPSSNQEDLSSVLFSAMDPDNIASLVENTDMFL
ncbi:uncharacterized protein LOC116620211 [Nematostella vectensis]|uniref:uncharacterized protein LOC116620211 n=1 Tax=Nematostella vectensis TaxID=45351 RepID=UPI0020774712|nr:uncharacterized protein LOC116620211 [Nematostella vectensis]XP_048582841.1 uncharacterized protein LOC116620211 [Nematostella vectensis]